MYLLNAFFCKQQMVPEVVAANPNETLGVCD